GRYEEAGARVHGRGQIVRLEQGPGADRDFGYRIGDGTDRGKGSGRAQGDFHDLDTACEQRPGHRHGVIGIVELDYRNDRPRPEYPGNIPRHFTPTRCLKAAAAPIRPSAGSSTSSVGTLASSSPNRPLSS